MRVFRRGSNLTIHYLRTALKLLKNYILHIIILLIILGISSIVLGETLGWVQVGENSSIAPGLGAVGTLILALVTVHTIKQNEKLIETQRAQLRPRIIRRGDFQSSKQNGSIILFELENVGEGKAVNMWVKPRLCVIDSENVETLKEHIENNDTNLPLMESKLTAVHRYDYGPNLTDSSGAVLGEGERELFDCRISLNNKENSSGVTDDSSDSTELPSTVVFEKFIDVCDDLPGNTFGLEFELSYQDILGEKYSATILGPIFKAEEVEEVEDIIDYPLWDKDMNVTVIPTKR